MTGNAASSAAKPHRRPRRCKLGCIVGRVAASWAASLQAGPRRRIIDRVAASWAASLQAGPRRCSTGCIAASSAASPQHLHCCTTSLTKPTPLEQHRCMSCGIIDSCCPRCFLLLFTGSVCTISRCELRRGQAFTPVTGAPEQCVHPPPLPRWWRPRPRVEAAPPQCRAPARPCAPSPSTPRPRAPRRR